MYFLWLKDKQTGPFTLPQVQEQWRTGEVHGEILYWREGMPEWTPLHAIHHVIEECPARMILGGFWRRTAAFLVDALILGVAGYVSGLVFFDFYIRLGPYGILLGLAVASAYFGLLDSALGSGQTPGKRVFGIRVVDAAGRYLTPARAARRFLVLSLPWWLNKAVTSGLLGDHFWLQILLSAVAASALVSLLYLYLFNRETQQSLHDLAVGSHVIRASSPPEGGAPAFPRRHFLAIAILNFVVVGFFVVIAIGLGSSSSQRMLRLRADLLATGDIRTAAVTENVSDVVSPKKANTSRICTADVVLKARPRSMETATNDVAALVMKADPAVAQDDYLRVSATYGYDIGIAWSFLSEGYARTPAEWQAQINPGKDDSL